MGLGTCALFGLDVVAPGIGFTTGDTFLVGTSIGTVAVAGALAGVVWELHRSKRRLGLRNEVMHRVLRHNLRNDMTVVLCLLDEIEATTDGESQQHVDRARETIDGLVAMTDKVRQVNVTANTTHTRTEPIDLVGVVENRVRKLRADNPGVEITTDLPAEAPVAVSGEFGIVVDNVVESALSRAAEDPRLHLTVTRERGSVELTFEDHTGAIPEADLFAVAAESETDLEHGFGVELWLVHWLVDANDGELRFETEGETRCIRIELDAPRGGILRL
jgi:K+-sensing histidine kinase KdpD